MHRENFVRDFAKRSGTVVTGRHAETMASRDARPCEGPTALALVDSLGSSRPNAAGCVRAASATAATGVALAPCRAPASAVAAVIEPGFPTARTRGDSAVVRRRPDRVEAHEADEQARMNRGGAA